MPVLYRRINTALAMAIRLAKNPPLVGGGPTKDYKRIDNEARPDEAFTTDRAVRYVGATVQMQPLWRAHSVCSIIVPNTC